MGLGRREFLRLFGAAIASASATPTSALAVCDDLYINRRLGIAFQKPAGWVFANIQQMKELKDGQILGLDDPEEARAFLEATDVPLLMISKAQLDSTPDQFTPGVTVFREIADTTEADYSDKIALLDTSNFDIANCETLLKGFQVLSPPCSTIISGCDAVSYEAKFLFEHELITPTLVRMKSLMIAQGPMYYTLRMYDSPYIGGEQVFDYSDFVSQIRIV